MDQQDTFINGYEADPKGDELYDSSIIGRLDWSKAPPLKGNVTPWDAGPSLVLRPLCKLDYSKGFPQILSQMTALGEISKDSFEKRFEEMRYCPGHYYVTVVEDIEKGRIVGAASLAIELKFIRGCTKRGRLEDVVVDREYRGRQLGKLLVNTITLLAEHIGCYKMSLDCADDKITFYESLGYKREDGNDKRLVIRF